MKPARFDYKAPRTLSEVTTLLAAEDARIIAGGQSLVPMMNLRLAQPTLLVDINGLPDLASISTEESSLAVGALVRHHDLARDEAVRRHCPILAAAAESIGYYAIRQRGTLGGSLVHADPAAQLPLLAILLDAEMEVVSVAGPRRIAAADFFESVFTTAIQPDELLTTCRFATLARGEGWGFATFSLVAGDYAIASAAATLLREGDGRIAQLRLAVSGLADTPLRIDTAGAIGSEPSLDWIAAFSASAASDFAVEDTVKVSAEYRCEIVVAMIEDALADAARRSG